MIIWQQEELKPKGLKEPQKQRVREGQLKLVLNQGLRRKRLVERRVRVQKDGSKFNPSLLLQNTRHQLVIWVFCLS